MGRVRILFDTHSEYVMFIAFPLQQRLHERALNVTLCVHCLFCLSINVCGTDRIRRTVSGNCGTYHEIL